MAGAGDGELPVGYVFVNRAAGTGGHFIAQRNGRNQHAVGADAYFVADDGFVFVDTVVVGDDGAGTEIGFAADAGIADVGQVVGFGAFADGGIFHFDEVADVHIFGQFGLRTQTRVRADDVVFADFAIFQ